MDIKLKFFLKNIGEFMSQDDFYLCCLEGDYELTDVMSGKRSNVIPVLCSGVKSKSGTEIYHGDICRVVTNGSCYQETEIRLIEFKDGRFNVGSGAVDAAVEF